MSYWQEFYCPPDMSLWVGRPDALDNEYFYQRVKPLNLLQPISVPQPSIALLGFACDIGVRRNLGRPGAAEGPKAIKSALARLPLHHPINLYDAGVIEAHNDLLEEAQSALAETVDLLLKQGFFPIILGGGHETAWGHYQALEKNLQQTPLTIINFDAHFDLRDLPSNKQSTSGTPFRQIAMSRLSAGLNFDYTCIGIQPFSNTPHLFKIADELKVRYLLAADIYSNPKSIEKIIAPLLKLDHPIYLTLCLDVFASAYAPGVSAPQILGLTPWQILPALRILAQSGKLISFDIVEMAPQFDLEQKTCKLAAVIIAEVLHFFSTPPFRRKP
jgi:formiminoglutamase